MAGALPGNLRHGHYVNGRRSPTYHSWQSMIARCTRPTHVRYEDYGGRGIRVCPSWRTFDTFLADMGTRPAGHTLDRIDVNGDYEPDNCRWATPKTQRWNQRDHQGYEQTSPTTLHAVPNPELPF